MREIDDSSIFLLGMELRNVGQTSFVTSLGEQPVSELIGDRFYMRFSESGVLLDAELDGRVASIFFHGTNSDEYRKYSGSLPDDLSFSDSRSEVRKKLGVPSASGGGIDVPMFGKAPNWDRYDRDSYSLHLQYSPGEDAIAVVTLMRADVVPL
jgi:hypothetical protein